MPDTLVASTAAAAALSVAAYYVLSRDKKPSGTKNAPGPKGVFLLGNALQFDPLNPQYQFHVSTTTTRWQKLMFGDWLLGMG